MLSVMRGLTHSVGSRVFFINQVEDEETAEIARRFLLSLKKEVPGMFAKLLFGSVQGDICQEV